MPPTIADVARAAGVSTATVSRVLNGNTEVNEVLAARVRAAVSQLAYHPSRIARSLRTRRTSIWAMIISDIRNPFFTDMVRGVEDVAYVNGYSLVLCNAGILGIVIVLFHRLLEPVSDAFTATAAGLTFVAPGALGVGAGAGTASVTIGNGGLSLSSNFAASGLFINAPVNTTGYQTATNCSSSASPAVCGSAAAGSFVLPAAATTVTVNTTAVTANSQIMIVNDDSLGTKLSVTCNTALDQVFVSARVAATSFTITAPAAPVTNPNCYSYLIVN